MLYEAHNYIVNHRKLDRIINALALTFKETSRKDLQTLAESGCFFREFKINTYVYRAGTKPEFCYLLTSGSMKVEQPGFSAKSLQDRTIIAENNIFGDRDLN